MKASIAKAVAAKPAGSAGAFVSGCIVHCQTVFNEGEDRWDAWEIAGRKPREYCSNACKRWHHNKNNPIANPYDDNHTDSCSAPGMPIDKSLPLSQRKGLGA